MIPGFIAAVGAVIIGLLAATKASLGVYWLSGITWLVWFFVAVSIENKNDLTRLRQLGNLLPVPYDKCVQGLLRGLPRLLLPQTAEQDPPPVSGFVSKLLWLYVPLARDNADLINLSVRPWSWPVLDAAMRLAVAYPVAFALIQWAIFGDAIVVGSLELLPSNVHFAFRWIAVGAFLSISTIRIMSVYSLTYRQKPPSIAMMWLRIVAVTCGLVFVAHTVSSGVTPAFFTVAIAIIVAFSFKFEGIFTMSFAVALAIYSGSESSQYGQLAFLVGYAVVALVSWSTYTRRGLLGYGFAITLMSSASIFVVSTLPVTATYSMIALVSLAIVPLVNAVFDFVSYGLTISLLRAGYKKRGIWPLVYGIVDAFAALAIFFILSLTLIGTLKLIDDWRSVPLFNTELILETVRDRPFESFWVFAMVASTLVPTLVHVGLAIVYSTAWLPTRLWNRMIEKLDPTESAQNPILASFGITVLLGVYAALPAAAFYYLAKLIWKYGGDIRIVYADLLAAIFA